MNSHNEGVSILDPYLPDSFKYEDVSDFIRFITKELKSRDLENSILLNPLRVENVENLNELLMQMFHMSESQFGHCAIWSVIAGSDTFTLWQVLKYIWCRLPNGGVIGWDVYKTFELKEKEDSTLSRMFLGVFSEVLTSFEHLSIMNDFFELIVTLTLKLDIHAKCILGIVSLWGFEYGDATVNKKQNLYEFQILSNGVQKLSKGCDATLKLFKMFLRGYKLKNSNGLEARLEEVHQELDSDPQSEPNFEDTKWIIPLVTFETDKLVNPTHMLEKCQQLLEFTDHDKYDAFEDFVILKRIFHDNGDSIKDVKKCLTLQSTETLEFLSDDMKSIQSGWIRTGFYENTDNLQEDVAVERINLDSKFIYTWMSSMSYEQTLDKRSIFGKALFLEFEIDQFTKWIAFQECDITSSRFYSQEHILSPSPEAKKLSPFTFDSSDERSSSGISKESNMKALEKLGSPFSNVSKLANSLHSQSRSHDSIKDSKEKVAGWKLFPNFKRQTKHFGSVEINGTSVNNVKRLGISLHKKTSPISDPFLISSSSFQSDLDANPFNLSPINSSNISVSPKHHNDDTELPKHLPSKANSKHLPKQSELTDDENVFRFDELQTILRSDTSSDDQLKLTKIETVPKIEKSLSELLPDRRLAIKTSSQTFPNLNSVDKYGLYCARVSSPLKKERHTVLPPINTSIKKRITSEPTTFSGKTGRSSAPPIEFPDYTSQKSAHKIINVNENIESKVIPTSNLIELKGIQTMALERPKLNVSVQSSPKSKAYR